MGLWDTLASAGNWLSDNESWLKPAANIAGNYMQTQAQNKARNQYSQYLTNKEQTSYDQGQANWSAYQDYLNQLAGWQAANDSSSSGSSGPSTAALAAMAKGKKILQPFNRTAKEIMPQMKQSYLGALGKATNLLGQMNPSTKVQSAPAYSIDIFGRRQ